MIILIPFFLLKLRKKLQKARTKENIEELQNLIVDDIMGSIEKNEKAGNISIEDAKSLRILTWKLYEEIYAQYAELEGVMRKWYDQSLDLESDRYLDKIDALEEELKEKDTMLKEKDIVLDEMSITMKEKDSMLKEQGERIHSLTKGIEILKKQLEELQKK